MIEINGKKLCESCFSEIEEYACPVCGFSRAEYTPAPTVLPLGTKLNGKIIIGKVMGKGGFGITYLGYDIRMEKTIAVKEYYPNGIAYRSRSGTEVFIADSKSAESYEKGAEKFYSEAQMVAQFNGNPNIVSVYDYFHENNTVYLIMEYLNGITLKNYVKKHGRLSDGQALYIMDKIASALSITHSAGILHRDISPDNIMLCADQKVKLIDFGAARQIMAESSSNLTVVMKPGYTPIEQYTKKGRQGAWTDIYSLGVSVYYAMTQVIIDDPYERMDGDEEFEENKYGINDTLWSVLKKCTMINASERYGNAIELKKALSLVCEPVKAEPIILDDDDLNETGESQASLSVSPVIKGNAMTAEPPEVFSDAEDNSGYDPSVNVYENTAGSGGGKKSKALAAVICAAAVAVMGAVGIVMSASRSDKPITDTGSTGSSGVANNSRVKNTAKSKKTGTEENSEDVSAEVGQVSSEPGPYASLGSFKMWLNCGSNTETDINYWGWGAGAGTNCTASAAEADGDGEYTIDLITDIPAEYNKDSWLTVCTDIDPQKWLKLNGGEGADDIISIVSITADGRPVITTGNSRTFLDKFDRVVVEIHNPTMLDEDRREVNDMEELSGSSEIRVKLKVNGLGTEATRYNDGFIQIDSEYAGDWELTGYIPKGDLEQWGTDVKVTLDIETGDFSSVSGLGYQLMPCREDKSSVNNSFSSPGSTEINGRYELYEGQTKFEFIIGSSEISGLGEKGLCFRTENIIVRSALLEPINTTENELTETDGKVVVECDGVYPGDWMTNVYITKERLMSFDGDIKVTMDIKPGIYNDKIEPWYQIFPIDDCWNSIPVSIGGEENRMFSVSKEDDSCSFVITRDMVEILGDDNSWVGFLVHNVVIKSVTLEAVG